MRFFQKFSNSFSAANVADIKLGFRDYDPEEGRDERIERDHLTGADVYGGIIQWSIINTSLLIFFLFLKRLNMNLTFIFNNIYN